MMKVQTDRWMDTQNFGGYKNITTMVKLSLPLIQEGKSISQYGIHPQLKVSFW